MDTKGLGKLLPRARTMSVKRRRKTQSREDTMDSGDDVLGGGAELRTPELRKRESAGVNSLGVGREEDEDTGFMSYESDPDSSARPNTISSHPSQVGYLTTSSPLVQAVHQPESQLPDDQSAELASKSSKSSTFPTRRSDSVDSESRTSRSQTGLVLPPAQSRRSPSPAGRIKGIFRSKKSSSSLGGSVSPERRVADADAPPLPLDGALSKLDRPAEEADAAANSRAHRVQSQKLDTTAPPRTPPTSDTAAPLIVNTPPTPTSPGFRNQSTAGKQSSSDTGSPQSSVNGVSPSGTMPAHRRLRSGSGGAGPSKLSNITSAPLSPTPENPPTTQPANQTSGFFSSMISVAQNAANTLSNTIQAPGSNKAKGSAREATAPPLEEEEEEEDSVEVEPAAEAFPDAAMDEKEPAVKTLGTGDLSLSQLGLPEPPTTSTVPAVSKFPEMTESRGRSDSTPVETTSSFVVGDAVGEPKPSQPRSASEAGARVEGTPSAGSVDEKPTVPRAGSIRTSVKRRRTRNSSATTGAASSAIGAAIAAANASVAHPSANSSGPKIAGIAVASKKENRDFHNLFKSVPDDDYLLDHYSCALQREILAHGRLYVSEGHLCFNSNIFGWVTTLVMSFDEIVSVEKRNTALVFKNGLLISTLQNKHVFASFATRDATYDLIVKVWKLGHPSLRSSLNGVQLEGTGGDKTEKIVDGAEPADDGGADSSSGSEESDDDEVYDEDDQGDFPETTQATELTAPETEADKTLARRPSGMVGTNGAAVELPNDAPAQGASGTDFPGPATHAPTDCGDSGSHYEKIIADDVISAPLGKVFGLIFGARSVTFMSNWLTNDQKCRELQMEDKNGLSLDNRSRTFTYIKPLSAPIGPKQATCVVVETVDNLDWEKAANVSVTTQNPDVPNGNSFTVKTKYCLSWAENNSTRIQVNCMIEWTAKSWLKNTIDRNAVDGQMRYCKELFASIRNSLSSRPRSGTGSNGAPVKAKKKGRKGRASQSAHDGTDSDGTAKNAAAQNWGIFEPIRPIAEPIVDIVKPIFTGNVMYGLLVGLLVATWFGFGFTNRQSSRQYGSDMGYYNSPDRLAAFDEMWRREESELWDWLEDRVGLDRLNDGPLNTRKRAMEPRTVEEKIREERMDDRELEEAIKVTEDKLKVLKGVVDRKKTGAKASPK